MRRLIIALIASLCSVATPALAQDALKPGATAPTATTPTVAAPVVSELDALKLDKLVLADENVRLRIAQAQQELSRLQSEAQAYVQTLQKPGYTLTRDERGAWVYVAAKKTP